MTTDRGRNRRRDGGHDGRGDAWCAAAGVGTRGRDGDRARGAGSCRGARHLPEPWSRLAVGGYWIWAGIAVGRASRFARALSTVFLALTTAALLASVVLVPVLSASSSDSTYDSTGYAVGGLGNVGGIGAVVTLGLLAVSVTLLVLLWGPASTRAFFAGPLPCTVCAEPAEHSARFCGQCGHGLAPRVPSTVVAVQVLLALNAICEVGMVVVAAGGAMLMGAIGPSIAADGFGDAGAVGALGTASAVLAVLAVTAAVSIAVDLWAIPRVASGRPAARLVVSVWVVLDPLVTLAALAAQGASGTELVSILVVGGLLPATLLLLLWAPPSSARHFAPRSPAATPAAASIPGPRQAPAPERPSWEQPSAGQVPRTATRSLRIPEPRPASALAPRPGRPPAHEPLTTPTCVRAQDTRLGPPSGRHATPGPLARQGAHTGRHAAPDGRSIT